MTTRRSRRDKIAEWAAGLLILLGWPSAVGLYVVKRWRDLFAAGIQHALGSAVVVVSAGLGALFFSGMGFGPILTDKRISARSLVILAVVTLSPTVVLALFLYDVV